MFEVSGLTELDLVGELRSTERTIAAAHAEQLRLIAELHARSTAWVSPVPTGVPEVSAVEVTAAEVGSALRWSTLVATDRVGLALAAAERTPAALAALAAGRLTFGKLRALVDRTSNLTVEQVAAVEATILERATEQTPAQFGVALRRAVLRCDPDAARVRAERACREREVAWWPVEDGMAVLRAVLPATEAMRCHQALSDAARSTAAADAAAGVEDDRTVDARRADLLVDRLLNPGPGPGGNAENPPDEPAGGPGRPSWSRAETQVHVTVPWTVLAGLSDDVGEVTGYGPVDADTACRLAVDATWRRILTDPASGAVLDVGTTSYRPPAALAEHVRTRDGTCRFPGCRRTARRSALRRGADLDHTVPYPHGPTSTANLAALCRLHHRLKTHTRWSVEQFDDGQLEWTSPTGAIHTTDPPGMRPPDEWPEDDPPATR